MRSPDLTVVVFLELLFVASQTEITYLYCPIIIEQYILRLQVTMQDLLLMQIHQRHRNLLRNIKHAIIIQHIFLLMKQLEERALIDELSDHVIEVSLVQTHPHVKHNIGVSELIDHFNFLNEVLDGLPRQVPLPELLYPHFRPHPLTLIHVSVSTSSDEICLAVELQLLEVYVEVK